MRSAHPLIKNDARLHELVELLKTGASLKAEAAEWGYASEEQLRDRLRELLGEDVYKAALKERGRQFRRTLTPRARDGAE